ncbi:MAG: S41 family peptidase [Sphingomonas sp.]|nr:S41 family peptidase [Sphingomonas sp.]
MRRVLSIMLTGLAASIAPPAIMAAQGQPPAAPAAQADPRAVVAQVRRILAERYVLPERRPALDAILARGLAAGRYDVSDPATLADRISSDLAEAGNDKHLGFSYNPQQAAMLSRQPEGGPPNPEIFRSMARANNHGVSELRVLPGNIRYMNYTSFMWTGPDSAAALERAMRFLADGDAVIIDLRYNGGGSPAAVQYIVSHFLPPDRPLVEFHMGGQPEPDRLSTLAELPAGRMIGKPLYVLTSRGSASAAEEFTGHVAGFRLGETVGATTAGAAFRNELVPVAGGYVLSVSVGRPVLAATGGDWEATGIAPTVPADVERALDVAQLHALRRLAAEGPEPQRAQRGALAEAVAARLEPRAPARRLDAYAGRFGIRRVTAEDGRLFYQVEDRPRIALIPLGGDRFALESSPGTRLDFEASDGIARAISLGPAGGPPQGRYERTP